MVRAILAGMGWSDEPPEARGRTRDRWESWQALVGQAEEYAARSRSPPTSTASSTTSTGGPPSSTRRSPHGVTLATFHAAKGLEWDSVFLVGLQDGTLPITYADTPEALEEERRLLYVGMTRARDDLALSWAQARNPGQAARRKPSRFLDAAAPRPGGPAPPRRRRAGARGSARCAARR